MENGISRIVKSVLSIFKRPTVEDDSGAQQEFPTQIHLLYAISRALRKGDAVTGRKSLPIELIIEIFRLAEFVRPSLLKHSNQSFSISDGGREILHIDANTLFPRRMRLYLQLETTSHDQGWCSDPNSGNWTWFQINILQPGTPFLDISASDCISHSMNI
ncbi:hypothetical protein FRC20_000022 [Serendipita sp. 405]|nr:hypothetical protein FRC20_000022 [Serendipita sp. 405]